MKKSIHVLLIIFMASFCMCIIYLTYIQVFCRQWLSNHPANTSSSLEYNLTILDAGDNILFKQNLDEDACNVPETLSHLLGYQSKLYGSSGIQKTIREHLLSLTDPGLLSKIRHDLKINGNRQFEAKITIDLEIQEYAEKLMMGKEGAIVVINPLNGAVMASVSNPGFNIENIDNTMKILQKQHNSPLFNRATSGLYPPASIFKLIIAGAALEENLVSIHTNYYCSGNVDGVNCWKAEGHGRISLEEAVTFSCNSYFYNLTKDLNMEHIVKYSNLFGFDMDFQLDVSHRASTIEIASIQIDLAQVSLGQAGILMTPIHAAMIASSIANNGVIMSPYFIESISKMDGKSIYEKDYEVLGRPISPFTAVKLKNMMIEVVKRGTGVKGAVKQCTVAGKTGTAEIDGEQPHSWFVGFAPADDPVLAFSVIIEKGGAGGDSAAPVAGKLIEYILFGRSDIYGIL